MDRWQTLQSDAAKAKTDSFKDGWITRHDNPYAKGGARERFNPLTGEKYNQNQNNDINNPELLPVESTSLLVPKPRNAYNARRGRGGFVKRGDGKGWKDKGRKSTSPYNRPDTAGQTHNASNSENKA